jgi:hypothetical protein
MAWSSMSALSCVFLPTSTSPEPRLSSAPESQHTHPCANINLLRRDSNITLVGAPEKPLAVAGFGLLFRRRSLSGSPIGGIPETQEMQQWNNRLICFGKASQR